MNVSRGNECGPVTHPPSTLTLYSNAQALVFGMKLALSTPDPKVRLLLIVRTSLETLYRLTAAAHKDAGMLYFKQNKTEQIPFKNY